jgi:hypothetical protein
VKNNRKKTAKEEKIKNCIIRIDETMTLSMVLNCSSGSCDMHCSSCSVKSFLIFTNYIK